MQSILWLIAILALFFQAIGQERMVLVTTGGVESGFPFSSVTKITFDSLSMTLHGPDETQAISSLRKIVFGSGTAVVGSKTAPKTIFSVYPNPFNPSLQIKVNTMEKGKLSISVYDLSGKKVRSITDDIEKPGIYVFGFDGRGLASGTYVLAAKCGKSLFTGKIIMAK